MRPPPPAAVLLFVAVAPLAAQPPGAELSLARSDAGYLAVGVEARAGSMRLALDTGSTLSMLTAEYAARLGLVAIETLGVVDARGELVEGRASGPTPLALAGGGELLLPQLAWIPGRDELLPSSAGLDGVLGADLLAARDVWIDPRGRRLRVAGAGELAPWFDGVAVAADSLAGRPAIAVELLDVGPRPLTLRLVVDSGADAVVLFGDAAERLAAARRGTPLLGFVELVTAHGRAVVEAAEIGRARAGGRRLRLGRATLLPAVRDRLEDGLVPLDRLGPVLFELASGRLRLDATPRRRPRPDDATQLALVDGE